MSAPAPIPCPVEALTYEQAAVRLSCSVDALKENYDGPITYLGKRRSMPRISSHDLREWLDKQAGKTTVVKPNEWDGIDAESSGLQERQEGEAA